MNIREDEKPHSSLDYHTPNEFKLTLEGKLTIGLISLVILVLKNGQADKVEQVESKRKTPNPCPTVLKPGEADQ